MKKFMKKPNKKGFTLVECIIAVAVFAVMVMIVFMILTNARNAAVYANDTEEDLTQLIANVVGDETHKRYNDENTLQLNITGQASPLEITYDIKDGYKSFVLCPNTVSWSSSPCNYFSNNTDFMQGMDTEDFDPTVNQYICPICSNVVVQTLVCEDCGATGDHNDDTVFTYIKENGGYGCVACGGTSVHDPSVAEYVDANVKLNISGIEANAIGFGNVSIPSALARSEFVQYSNIISGGTETRFGELSVDLTYTGTANNTQPGIYKLTLNPAFSTNRPGSIDYSQDYTVTIKFPPHYKFVNPDGSGGTAVRELNSSTATATVVNGSESTDNSSITITFLTDASASFEFMLENVYTGFPFEYYFSGQGVGDRGLAEYWFGMSGVSVSVDSADGNITDYSVSGKIIGDLH